MNVSNLAFIPLAESKKCPHCSTIKLFTEFNNNKATKDGKQRLCRVCDNERLKFNRSNRDTKGYSKKYRTERFNDLNFRLRGLLNASKARASSKQREHSITLKDLYDLYPEDNKCPVFGFELQWNTTGFRETSPSIDRIDSSKGYTKDNIQIISWKANRLKAYATVEDLEAVLAFMKQGD